MFQVIYYSCTGNTRKVAEVIATVLGTAANDVRTVDIVSRVISFSWGPAATRVNCP